MLQNLLFKGTATQAKLKSKSRSVKHSRVRMFQAMYIRQPKEAVQEYLVAGHQQQKDSQSFPNEQQNYTRCH